MHVFGHIECYRMKVRVFSPYYTYIHYDDEMSRNQIHVHLLFVSNTVPLLLPFPIRFFFCIHLNTFFPILFCIKKSIPSTKIMKEIKVQRMKRTNRSRAAKHTHRLFITMFRIYFFFVFFLPKNCFIVFSVFCCFFLFNTFDEENFLWGTN